MAMFFCARCDNLRDSDDGCDEAPGFRLYCAECADELEEQRERRKEERASKLGAEGEERT
jgi:hypothetical protein